MTPPIKEKDLHPLEARVLRTIRRHGMLATGDHVLVAVSGGADSVALLSCLERLSGRLSLRLTVAHLNHALRGAEANADEEFVAALCSRLGLNFLSERCDVRAAARSSRCNLEEAARVARYGFLRRSAAGQGATKIATAHHRNDQAETVLLHFLRGTGLDGLAGIHPVLDSGIIRPLIDCTRDHILGYLRDSNLSWREDPSNADLKLRRNRLRHEGIPYLEKHFNPRLVASLAVQAGQARETALLLEEIARAEYEKLKETTRSGLLLSASRLLRLQPALAKIVLRKGLREARGNLQGITARHVEAMLRLCRPGMSGRMTHLPGGTIAARRFGRLILLRGLKGSQVPFFRKLPVPGLCRIPEAEVEIEARLERAPAEAPVRHPDFMSAVLDAEKITGELVVRSRLPGDRYGGDKHRKVKKMLIGAKIDLERRRSIPMVTMGDAVIWIPGFRPARGFAAPPDAARCIVLNLQPLSTRPVP